MSLTLQSDPKLLAKSKFQMFEEMKLDIGGVDITDTPQDTPKKQEVDTNPSSNTKNDNML